MSVVAQVTSTWRAEGGAAVIAKAYRVMGMRVLGERFYHRPVVNALVSRAQSHRTLIDVGAHIGTIVRAAAPAFARCIAVEPHPDHASALRRLTAEPTTLHIEVVEAALSRRSGTGRLTTSLRNTADNTLAARSDSSASIGVHVMTLDELIATRSINGPLALKIDVQGSELDVVAGGLNALQRPCVIVSEFWPWGLRSAGHEPLAYPDLLASLGYTARSLRGKRLARGHLQRLCEVGAEEPALVSDILFERGLNA